MLTAEQNKQKEGGSETGWSRLDEQVQKPEKRRALGWFRGQPEVHIDYKGVGNQGEQTKSEGNWVKEERALEGKYQSEK